MRKIILASASPWRKELLKRAGISFLVEVSGYDEDMRKRISPKTLARNLALEKARAVAVRHSNALIVAADTLAIFRGRVIGKPTNLSEAKKILGQLSGNCHSLITGFAIVDTGTGKIVTRAMETKVWFRKLSRREIDRYVKTREPLTVAGGYAIQGGGSSFANRIDGDFYNIVGLPLAVVVEELRKFGVGI
ncbi:MAG: septum formation protein Maf [Candidatus Kaiserbacteria bacterium GW2011_GWC2_49_12]|uniref:Nucleoside triphosphate pyrophosphatase n=4 Tax=Candidatus Kaiseribacteriota TaxID=1752734 RepID=A0A0G1YQI7_9BACT|nr:MAG: septum formation protein Maf [Candidatus Kaiserbacteria bacterium GW2011_GWC2_49_12]KKW17267.1 MAG: septum formation protein Maf [Candidatus Kaiserbacteria bacterium GW2011_GWB1_50_17]KKW18043.1 MAG: septum formation protein Maf [Candidatus Kaiserbacteria bacterium GW2011_GWA1_50_28]OGG88349.1 MAG: septum formation protein Maf [Candidatus Kaiserbacteria bacterium RIFCSPLOWO2_12_FULL_50_28]HCM43341.1 septum formation inhibitor Maf [Candidatus Kaiserbacteria bacterium]